VETIWQKDGHYGRDGALVESKKKLMKTAELDMGV
jgi:hypothetical protein